MAAAVAACPKLHHVVLRVLIISPVLHSAPAGPTQKKRPGRNPPRPFVGLDVVSSASALAGDERDATAGARGLSNLGATTAGRNAHVHRGGLVCFERRFVKREPAAAPRSGRLPTPASPAALPRVAETRLQRL